jgi:hypothetical protein
MKQATKLCMLIAIGALTWTALPLAQAAALGSIRGFVKDVQGRPLAGAAVVVLAETEEAKADKVVKRASTDKDGKFVAGGILPGRYRIKAEADGFSPVEIAADVVANKATVFDAIFLSQVSTLAEQTNVSPDPKYSARRVRSSVLHFDEPKKSPGEQAGEDVVALTDRSPELHGVIQAFSQTSPGSAGLGPFVGTNFALSQQLGRDASLVISGQAGYGEGAPQRLQALTAYSGDRHHLSVALGYGRFIFSRRGTIPKLGQFSLSAIDTWQVSGPVLVVYGLEIARFTEGAVGTSVVPRLRFAVDASPRTRLFAGLTPGSSVDEQSRINLESGEIVLGEAKAVALTETGQPVMDRSYRLHIGGEQVISDKSSVELMAFFDTVSGHGVGLLAVPAEGPMTDSALRTETQSGRTRGVRVVYRRRMSSGLEGAVGYAFGEGQQFSSRGIAEPANLFSNTSFHVFTAKVDASFISTGTRVSTVLRIAPERAVFAIDPFQGQITTYDPNVSVSVSQTLPSPGFLPGHWEAVVDLRNLLDQQASVGDERQELIASRFNRLVRVGLSLRF